MRVTTADWNRYWEAREAAVSARIGRPFRVLSSTRLEIMSAEIYVADDVIDARDLRPDDFTKYGLEVPADAR